MENIQIGLLLMAVGMTTVFSILLLVIYLGKGLILLVNKYAPEEEIVKRQVIQNQTNVRGNTIPGTITAAIVSAISILTSGQGKVTKIEKL